MIDSPITTALNSSTFVPIKLAINPRVNNIFNPIAAYTSNNTEWELATDVSGTDAVPVLVNQTYNNTHVKMDTDGTIFYARALAGVPNLIVHVGLEERSRSRK